MIDEMTKADVQKARQALNAVAVAEQKIEIAKACGVDCADDEARCKHWKEVCTNYLALFGNQFPGRKE